MIIKKRLQVFLAILCLALMLVTSRYHILFNKNKILHIAAVGPMSGNQRPNGEEMLKGIRLYLQDFNAKRKLNDPKIELSIFDDKADKSIAMRAANQIIQQNKALIVLGIMTVHLPLRPAECTK